MKKFKKIAASVAALATAAVMSVGTLSAGAFELEKTAAKEKFISDYEDMGVGDAAKFLVDNGFELSQAEYMMDLYIEGLELRATEISESSAKRAIQRANNAPDFYSSSNLSGNQHYGLVVFNGTSTGAFNLNLGVNFNSAYSVVSTSPTMKFWNSTTSFNPSVSGNFASMYDQNGVSVSSIPEAMFDFTFGVGASATSEASMASGFSILDSNNPDVYEIYTYVQGDINHDGLVNVLDYLFIFEYNMNNATLDDLRTEYSNSTPSAGVAKLVNSLAADVDKDGQISLSDLTWISNVNNRD